MKLKPGMILRAKYNLGRGSYPSWWKFGDIVFLIGRSRFSQSNGPSWTLMYNNGEFMKYAAKTIQQYFRPL